MTNVDENGASGTGSGEIRDGGIRYVLMRPDVLMGVARELVDVRPEVFLNALEKSAFVHGMRSFQRYREEARFGASDALQSTCKIAATLGWGEWVVHEQANGSILIDVRDSPFAAGFGASPIPVCAPILGILKAMTLVFQAPVSHVEEVFCRSQGAEACRFSLR